MATNGGAQDLAFTGIHIAGKPANSRWDLCCKNGFISSIEEHESGSIQNPDNRLLGPSLCHPHIHLDKAFLLSHPKYADLEIQKGDFSEAMILTSRANSQICLHLS